MMAAAKVAGHAPAASAEVASAMSAAEVAATTVAATAAMTAPAVGSLGYRSKRRQGQSCAHRSQCIQISLHMSLFVMVLRAALSPCGPDQARTQRLVVNVQRFHRSESFAKSILSRLLIGDLEALCGKALSRKRVSALISRKM
jgi:hypothetical protein